MVLSHSVCVVCVSCMRVGVYEGVCVCRARTDPVLRVTAEMLRSSPFYYHDYHYHYLYNYIHVSRK